MFIFLVQVLIFFYGGIEGEFFNVVWRLVLVIDVDMDLICNFGGIDCRGGCIKCLVVSQLCVVGYDVVVCKFKWEGFGCVFGGNQLIFFFF